MSITKFKKLWLMIMTVTVMVLIPSCRSWLPQETHVVILGLLICMAFPGLFL